MSASHQWILTKQSTLHPRQHQPWVLRSPKSRKRTRSKSKERTCSRCLSSVTLRADSIQPGQAPPRTSPATRRDLSSSGSVGCCHPPPYVSPSLTTAASDLGPSTRVAQQTGGNQAFCLSSHRHQDLSRMLSFVGSSLSVSRPLPFNVGTGVEFV